MKIDGTAAVVTGGASGLGEGTARALAAKGAKVAIFDRDAERGEAIAKARGAALHPAFAAVQIDTGFIARELDALVAHPEPGEELWRAAAAVATAENEEDSLGSLAGFRLNAPGRSGASLGRAGAFRHVSLDDEEDVAAVSGFRDEERVVIFYEGQAFAFDRSARGSIGAAAGDGAILAPMPGKVTSVEVAAGDAVTKGQRLLTLEAMKMEHGLVAPFDGVVAELNAVAGGQVPMDAVLARIEKHDN
jgi:3-methylcrotonyl-CoA carboxylase alpha subunit